MMTKNMRIEQTFADICNEHQEKCKIYKPDGPARYAIGNRTEEFTLTYEGGRSLRIREERQDNGERLLTIDCPVK